MVNAKMVQIILLWSALIIYCSQHPTDLDFHSHSKHKLLYFLTSLQGLYIFFN